MKRRYLVCHRLLMACAALLLTGTAASSQQQTPPAPPTSAAKGRQYTPPFYVFSPDIPHDMITHDVGAIGFQPFADILAWDTFVALNWPAPSPIKERGIPDRQNITGGFLTSGGEGTGPKSMPTGPVVWETYKDTNDIYLNPPVKPTSFDAPESVPPACRQLAAANPAAARRTLAMASKFDVISGKVESDGNRLIDQNGMHVWYEVKLNRVYYDYVVSRGYYNSNNQKGKTISFPASWNTQGGAATIKVKAAWKVMGLLGSKQPDDLTKFYTIDALVYDTDTNKCVLQKLGLVGLHIVMKTGQLPQWLWATFEHVSNAPSMLQSQAGGSGDRIQYNFFNRDCQGCPINQPPAKDKPTVPTQVVRVVPVDDASAVNTNTLYQTALRTLRADNVWANYMLVNAQWGASATPIGVPNQPKFLANTTLETYLQEPKGDHGCINCHGKFAGTTDLDFQLTNAYPAAGKPRKPLDRVLALPGVSRDK